MGLLRPILPGKIRGKRRVGRREVSRSRNLCCRFDVENSNELFRTWLHRENVCIMISEHHPKWNQELRVEKEDTAVMI